ncbi:MAG: AfsR/SARP family transcriptional regulator [Butyricicoccus sp.]
MNGPTLQVQMLGQFTLRYGDRTISDSDDRSRRVWSLLAYMLYNHGRSFAQEELIHLYWSNNEKSADPGNALKSIFHRIRSALDKLQPGLGRLLIRRKAGRYFWNNAMPLSLDIEDFEAHFHAAEAAGDDDVRLAEYQAALALYAGDPLPRMTDEIWTIPIVAYYHSLYTRAAAGAIELLEKQERTAEAVALCRRAIHIEPYQEDLYEHLMRGLLRTGDMKGAMSVYEEMSEQLFAHFGVMPSETLRTLYRQATRTVNDRTLTMDEVCSQLEEPAPHGGAMVCEYDFFKILYRAEARSIARNGHSANICLLSVSARRRNACTPQSGPRNEQSASACPEQSAPRRCDRPMQHFAVYHPAAAGELRKQPHGCRPTGKRVLPSVSALARTAPLYGAAAGIIRLSKQLRAVYPTHNKGDKHG